MRRRSARPLLILVLLTVPAIAAIWTLVPVKYRARAEVRINPVIPYLVFQTEETGEIPFYESFVNTQASIIRGPAVLTRVLERREVQATKWFGERRLSLMQRLRGDQIPRVERLRNSLVVRPRLKTEIMDVMLEDPSAGEARLILQAVVDEYVRYVGTVADKDRDDLYRQLSNEYRKLNQDVQHWEGVCFHLQEELGTGDPDRLRSNRAIALDEGQAALATIRQDIVRLELQIEKGGGVDPNESTVKTVAELKSQPKYYTDAEWSRLDTMVRSAQRAINTSPLKASHPSRVTMEKELEFAEKMLRQREEQLDEQWLLASGLPALTAEPNSLTPQRELEYRRNQLYVLKEQAKLMEIELTEKQEEYSRLFAKSQELKRATASLQHQRGLFDAVRARKDQKDMEKNIRGRISVLAPAAASFTPHNDRRILYTGIVLAVCLILVSGMARIRRRPIDKISQSR